MKTSGDDCPNCNEKATRRDVRLHYVARLKAVDTAEKDRAVGDLEKFKCQLRTLELDHTTLKVTNAMQREEIDKVNNNYVCWLPRTGFLDKNLWSPLPTAIPERFSCEGNCDRFVLTHLDLPYLIRTRPLANPQLQGQVVQGQPQGPTADSTM